MNTDNKTFWESEFFRQNWFKLVIVLIVILIGASLFYWFQIRPSKIRASCIRQSEYCGGFANLGKVCTEQAKEIKYQDCLRKNGLEK